MHWIQRPARVDNADLIVRMVHAREDPVISLYQQRKFVAALKASGFDARLRVVDDDEHFAVLDPSEAVFRSALEAIKKAIAARDT